MKASAAETQVDPSSPAVTRCGGQFAPPPDALKTIRVRYKKLVAGPVEPSQSL